MKRLLIGTVLLCGASGLALAQDAGTFKYPSWMWEEGNVGVWHKARLAEFEAAHPDMKVEATLIPNSSFEGTITTQLAAGDVPDLLPVFTNMLPPLIDAGLLAPLDDCIAGSSFKDRILPSVSYAQRDGVTYGIPLTMSPQSLLYNKRLLDEAGVGVPTTIDEFYAAAKAVKEKTGAWGYAFNSDTANVLQTYIITMQWLIGLGSDWSQPDGTITANTPEAIEAVTWMNRFIQEGIAPRGLDATTIRTMFAEGKVAFLFDGPWVVTQIKGSNPDLLPDIGYAVMPTPTHTAITGGAFYTIPANAAHPEAACAYLDIINAEPAQREWLEGLLQIPGTSVQPSADFLKDNAWVGTMAEVAAKYPGGLGYAPQGYQIDAAEFRQIVVDHLAPVFAGSASVEDSLNELQTALQDWAASL
jgi:ABC-type glycerol-3-phosphate transport system substrate-binding protein